MKKQIKNTTATTIILPYAGKNEVIDSPYYIPSKLSPQQWGRLMAFRRQYVPSIWEEDEESFGIYDDSLEDPDYYNEVW
jgi:hypothetical protein